MHAHLHGQGRQQHCERLSDVTENITAAGPQMEQPVDCVVTVYAVHCFWQTRTAAVQGAFGPVTAALC